MNPNLPARNILNIAAYLFVEISDLPQLQSQLRDKTQDLQLKGTILLAPEGINLFLAGDEQNIRDFLSFLRADALMGGCFSSLYAKESWSPTQPFNKMRVRLKKEIIRMNHPTIRPANGRAQAVSPQTLKRWLDAGYDDNGREVVMLDTRNAFEVDAGTFTHAVDWRINKFTEFPQAVQTHLSPQEWRDKTVVSFCTGGIRCEKAAIYLEEWVAQLWHDESVSSKPIHSGSESTNTRPPTIYQLEGGILGYFEQCGGAHYQGGCFVFDQRETLDAQLQATPLEVAQSSINHATRGHVLVNG